VAYNWEKAQKHTTDVETVLKKHNCIDSQKRIRSWLGLEVFADLNALGHSSVGFKACKCNKE
tara:strand:- start:3933 stop:4118 length:186 start_codon:yes stop_codon:yes gene_type:complete